VMMMATVKGVQSKMELFIHLIDSTQRKHFDSLFYLFLFFIVLAVTV
jgi:hypothetical protein